VNTPAPSSRPVAVDPSDVRLRDVTGGDRFLVRRWLDEPHVAAWWGSRIAAEIEIGIAESSPSAERRMIELDGRTIGYLHALDAGAIDGGQSADLPAGCWLADLMIGPPSLRGRGIGAAALALLGHEVFTTTLTPAIAVLVPIRNEPAIRAFEGIGYRWQHIRHDAGRGPCWVALLWRR
jgi:aminoglycoside 6'-N-acetyltransferase